jgi:diacylglycerol kinase family enzyme
MKASVLLNVAAGSVETKETCEAVARVGAAFEAAGAEASVHAVEATGLADAVAQAVARDDDAVVLGGGDGTLSTGVAVLAKDGRPKPLGILPLGTFNHFAKDLGIPLDLEGAVRTVVAGCVRRVDLGEVNGKVFLNNASIGIYPELIREREEIRQDGVAPKWAAMLRAAADQLRRFPMVTVTLRLPDREMRVTSPLIFVGNNRYEMNLLRVGRRSRLDGGELFLYVARDRSRVGFAALALRATLGWLDREKDFVSAGLPCVEVATSWRRSLRVALDGEVRRLATPLSYRVRPRALRVLAPPVPA